MNFEWLTTEWLKQAGIQMLGFIAIGITFFAYQAKKRSGILFFQCLASTFWFFHFLFLGGTMGAIMNICAIVRALVYLMDGKVKLIRNLITPFLFSALFIGLGIIFWEGWIGLLSVVSLIISSFSMYMKKEKMVRILSFFASPPFLIYDLLNGSISGVVAEIFVMTSIIIALIRYRKVETEEKPKEV